LLSLRVNLSLSEIESGKNEAISHKEVSWLLAVTFAGLGTGFILLILTLSMVYAILLGSVGVLIVWPLARSEKGASFALNATAIYFVSSVIGAAVGWGSTMGTGLPVDTLLQKLRFAVELIRAR
jgi:hypothetical protein